MKNAFSGGIAAGFVLVLCQPSVAAETPTPASGSVSAAPAEPIPEMVTLSPAPGVRVSLPKEWIACDDPTNKLLGEAVDSLGLKTKICSGTHYTLHAYNPELFRTSAVILDYKEKQEITPEELANVTPEIMNALVPEVCKAATEPLTSSGDQIDSCKSELGEFAGHRALVTHIVATPKNGSQIQQFEITILELPYTKGYLQLQLNTPVLLKSATMPVLDAIRASVAVN